MVNGAAALGEQRQARLAAVDPVGTFAGIVTRCLEVDPTARPASALDVERALGAVVVAAVAPVSPAATTAARCDVATVAEPARRHGGRFGPRACRSSPSRGPRHAWRSGEDTQGADLGAVVAEQIADALSRVRELRVLAGVAPVTGDRVRGDRVREARELGAALVIDGAVHVDRERARVTIRLVDAASGARLWADAIDGLRDDLLEVGQPLARRAAEAMRVQVLARAYGAGVPAAAIQSYLDARVAGSVPETLRRLDAALAIAPGFAPALARHALVSPTRPGTSRSSWTTTPIWGARYERAVAGALAQAPALPDTPVAAAAPALSRGHGGEAVIALR